MNGEIIIRVTDDGERDHVQIKAEITEATKPGIMTLAATFIESLDFTDDDVITLATGILLKRLLKPTPSKNTSCEKVVMNTTLIDELLRRKRESDERKD